MGAGATTRPRYWLIERYRMEREASLTRRLHSAIILLKGAKKSSDGIFRPPIPLGSGRRSIRVHYTLHLGLTTHHVHKQ